MALYTRGGDKGFTMLPGPDGAQSLRVRKDDERLTALSELDATMAALGLCHAEAVRCGDQEIAEGCETLTDHLFRAGAILAAIFGGAKPRVSLDQGTIDRLEQRIDRICDDLVPLNCFIAPGGSELAARLHQARATARRAEGAVVSGLDRARHDGQPEEAAATVLRYLNRLSDCLFALARQANHNAGVEDRPWAP